MQVFQPIYFVPTLLVKEHCVKSKGSISNHIGKNRFIVLAEALACYIVAKTADDLGNTVCRNLSGCDSLSGADRETS